MFRPDLPRPIRVGRRGAEAACRKARCGGRERECRGRRSWTKRRLRAPVRRRFVAEPIELGNEPPLSVDGGSGGLIDRRRVSVQWFSGTILTGLCGAALMGGAVFASLDGETNFAAAPERVEIGVARRDLQPRRPPERCARPTGCRRSSEPNVERAGLARPHDDARARSRDGARAPLRARLRQSVAHGLRTLRQYSAVQSAEASCRRRRRRRPVGRRPQPDAEVSFVTCDFVRPPPQAQGLAGVCEIGSLLPKVKPSTLLPLDEVTGARARYRCGHAGGFASCRQRRRIAAASGSITRPTTSPTPIRASKPRIVPENITLLPKTQPNHGGTGWNERLHGEEGRERRLDPARSRRASRRDQGRSSRCSVPRPRRRAQGRREAARAADAGRHSAACSRCASSSPATARIEAAVALSDMGTYVPVDVRNVDTDVADTGATKTAQDDGPAACGSTRASTRPRCATTCRSPVIEELVRIYSYDVDFQRKVQPGDSFDVLYTDDENGDGSNEVLFASLTTGGETKKFYRFQTADDGMSTITTRPAKARRSSWCASRSPKAS